MKKNTILRELGDVKLIDQLSKLLSILEERLERSTKVAVNPGDEVTLTYPPDSSLRKLNGRKAIVHGIEGNNILIIDRGMSLLISMDRIKKEPVALEDLAPPDVSKDAKPLEKVSACFRKLEREEDINFFIKEVQDRIDRIKGRIAGTGDKVILNCPAGTRLAKYDRKVCQVKGDDGGRLIIDIDGMEIVIDHSRVLQLVP